MSQKVTILGAGAMGSALATPLIKAGNKVNLWGTWLDDHLIDAIKNSKPHPRTSVIVPNECRAYYSGDLAEALEDADIVVFATSSEGLMPVAEKAIKYLPKNIPIVLTSKGFAYNVDNEIILLPDALRELFAKYSLFVPNIIAVGGPCKANEVAAGRATATLFASKSEEVLSEIQGVFSTDTYQVHKSDDEIGLEVAAPMKNVYAISLGVADGLSEKDGSMPWHNLKSAIFAKAISEISKITQFLGGNRGTVYGLAGVGDLEVTGLSGRNKVFGSKIGRGISAKKALVQMQEAEQTVEGVPACAKSVILARQIFGVNAEEELPLLFAIKNLIDDGDDSVNRLITTAIS